MEKDYWINDESVELDENSLLDEEEAIEKDDDDFILENEKNLIHGFIHMKEPNNKQIEKFEVYIENITVKKPAYQHNKEFILANFIVWFSAEKFFNLLFNADKDCLNVNGTFILEIDSMLNNDNNLKIVLNHKDITLETIKFLNGLVKCKILIT